MEIKKEQLARRPKLVGKLDGANVMAIVTKGGYNILVASKGNSFETLGVGPHAAVARHIAKKTYNIKWNELSKSDELGEDDFQGLLPKYEAITEAMRRNRAKGE